MILVYHKIGKDIRDDSESTVHYIVFFLQLFCIKLLCKKVVPLNVYNPQCKRHIVIRFDDVDKVTLKYVIPILRFFNFKSEFFICDDFVKKGSYWANASELKVVVNKGHHLQYHSKTHKDLTLFSDERILGNEIITPYYLKTLDFGGFEYFAYPCWKYNPLIKSVVSKFYKGGLSGNGFSDYTIWAMDGIRVSNNFSFIKKIF